MATDTSHLRRDRMLFYAGLAMFLAGLLGLILGSWMHDLMRIPVVGNAYYEWGWMNTIAVYLGILIAVVGASLLVASLRGGLIDRSEISEDRGRA